MKERNESPPLLSAEDSLVAIMIAEGLSDEKISGREFLSITKIVDHLPIFQNYDQNRVQSVAQMVFDLFEEEDGLDALFGLVRDALPATLYETAYALACDVAAADGRLREAELQMLKEIRYELNIDRLHAAAIERGARARHQKI
ncbi:MAG: tellurite resistance TerB family protein [Pseudomonadota bacterium]|nr:tellurite resistance TerB family protein [Pseudomonadota bacterium]